MKPVLVAAALGIGWLSSGLPGVCALAAIGCSVALLAEFWAGLAAALVAATSPSFYVSRPESGLFGLAGEAMAVAGLATAALGPGGSRRRWCATLLGVAGMALGWRESGAVLGVALPGGCVALTWALARRPREGRAAACSAGAACAAALGAEALTAGRASTAAVLPLSTVAVAPGRSFDFPLGELGREFFPWSALLPVALAALAQPPRAAQRTPGAELPRLGASAVLMLSGTALAYGLCALPTADARAALSGFMLFVAGAIGLWLCDIGRGARVSAAAMIVPALLAASLGLDFLRLPEARLGTFAALAPPPESPPAAVPAPAAFMVSTGLTVTGALAACGLDSARARRTCARRARPEKPHAPNGTRPLRSRSWPCVAGALFVGTLLGALALRYAHHSASAAGSTLGSR